MEVAGAVGFIDIEMAGSTSYGATTGGEPKCMAPATRTQLTAVGRNTGRQDGMVWPR